jgi:hypothetical protein
VATLFNGQSSHVVVITGCDHPTSQNDVKVTSQNVGNVTLQHFRVQCYSQQPLELGDQVRVFTAQQFADDFGGDTYPDLTLQQVGALATAALTLWAICWGIKQLARLIFNSKAGRF